MVRMVGINESRMLLKVLGGVINLPQSGTFVPIVLKKFQRSSQEGFTGFVPHGMLLRHKCSALRHVGISTTFISPPFLLTDTENVPFLLRSYTEPRNLLSIIRMWHVEYIQLGSESKGKCCNRLNPFGN